MKPVKQFEVEKKVIGGNTFYIRPFPAFVSANISGELFSLIAPLFGSIVPMAAKAASDTTSILDVKAEEAAPILAQGLSSVGGDKVELLLKKLLIKHKNISVEVEDADEGKPRTLTEELANEIFCGDAQDMFILAFEVIKGNFSGFFEKVKTLFGGRIGEFEELIQPTESRSMEG